MQKTRHQQKVEEFMNKIPGQSVPDKIQETLPANIATLRAKLIFEECLETIYALGVTVGVRLESENSILHPLQCLEIKFMFNQEDFDLLEVIDGCCDVSVVVTGTMSALGLPMEVFQAEVDQNNLAKFGPGSSISPTGKLIKPPGHKPPFIKEILEVLKEKQNESERVSND